MPGELPADLRLHVRGRAQRRRGRRGRRRPTCASTSRSSPTSRTSSASRPAAPCPTGYYDREHGAVGRRAQRPRDQDRRPRPAAAPRRRRRRRRRRQRAELAALGITDAEREQLAGALRAGQEPVARRDHPLHAVGLQLALRPAARRRPPPNPPTPPDDAARGRRTSASATARSSSARARCSARRSPVAGTAVHARLLERPRPRPPARPRARDPADAGAAIPASLAQRRARDRGRRARFTQSFAPAPNLRYRSSGTGWTPTAAAAGRAAGDDPARLPTTASSATPSRSPAGASFGAHRAAREFDGARGSHGLHTSGARPRRGRGTLGGLRRRAARPRRLDARRPPPYDPRAARSTWATGGTRAPSRSSRPPPAPASRRVPQATAARPRRRGSATRTTSPRRRTARSTSPRSRAPTSG